MTKAVRWAVAVLAVAAMFVAAASAAGAAPLPPSGQGSGAGQSHLSAAFGFNVDLGLQGQFEYNADPAGPDAGFRGHCSGYAWVVPWQSWDGFPAMRFRSDSCTDQNGDPVHLRGKIVDRGEPGTNDYAHILWCYQPLPNGHCPLKGLSEVDDNGLISSGNIQVTP